MRKTTQMQIRLEPALKDEAEGILAQLGLSPTEFVRMSLRQLVMRKGLPFEARIPNAETQQAMTELKEDKAKDNTTTYANAQELFKALDT